MMRVLAANASGTTAQATANACMRPARNTLTTQCFSACAQVAPICVNYAARPSNESLKEGDGNYYYQGCAHTNMASCHSGVGADMCELQCLQTKNQQNKEWVLDVSQPQADRIETSLFVMVDKLRLPSTLQSLKLVGTTELTRKVPMTFEPDAFASGAGLQKISLVDLGVGNITSNIFPSSLSTLTMWRTLLTEFDLPGDRPLTNLRVLDLRENELTSIPLAVFDLPNLSELYLSANPISNVHITATQLLFLRKLEVFDATIEVVDGCGDGYTLYKWDGKSVCYGDDGAMDGDLSGTIPQNDEGGESSRSTSSTMELVLLVIAAVVVVLAILTGIFLLKRAKKRQNEARKSLVAEEQPKKNFQPLMTHRPNELQNPLREMTSMRSPLSQKMTFRDITAKDVRVQDVVVDTSALTVLHGTFGKHKVLVNRLHVSADAAENCETSLGIAPVVSQLRHPQLLTVIGFMWEDDHTMSAVCEGMNRGTLEDYLQSALTSLTWRNFKLKAAAEIAGCLMYLHSQSHKLTYDGLSARTVFVDSTKGCKLNTIIASLPNGLVKSHHAKSTRAFCAPEVMAGEASVSASDMYAFGVLLVQIDTCESADDMIRSSLRQRTLRDVVSVCTDSNASARSLPEDGVAAFSSSRGSNSTNASSAGLLSMFSFTSECPEIVKDLADSCLQIDPTMRPSAQYVTAMLQQHL